MGYSLSASQKAFYPCGLPGEETMWNHGIVLLFPQKYPYARINDAFNSLIARHDELRLHLRHKGKEPVFTVDPFQAEKHPLGTFSSREEVLSAARELVNKPMDLSDPLYRCTVFQTPRDSGVIICAHHIIMDGFSAQVMADHIQNYLEEGGEDKTPILTYADHFFVNGTCPFFGNGEWVDEAGPAVLVGAVFRPANGKSVS